MKTSLKLPQPAIRKTECRQEQLETYHATRELLDEMGGGLIPMKMGKGKSKVVVDLICNDADAQSVLICCPKSVLGVWRREFLKHGGRECDLLILDRGTVATKAKLAEKHFAFTTGKPRVLVVNYESAWRTALGKFIKGMEWDWIILDESHFIKGQNSKVSKFFGQLGRE